MSKKLTIVYIGLQSLVCLISFVFLWGMLAQLLQQIGGLIIVDVFLLTLNVLLGLHFSIKNLRDPADFNMKMMTYVPFLLFIEGGILAGLGFLLMTVGMLARFTDKGQKHAEVKKQKNQFLDTL